MEGRKVGLPACGAMMGSPPSLPGDECREGWLESSELRFVSFHPDPSAESPFPPWAFRPPQGTIPS